MNPNLLIFLKRTIVVISIGLVIWLLVYVINSYTSIDLPAIGESVMYVFFGLVMAFVIALSLGVMLKVVWINIMRRTDNIDYCCPDENGDGVHIIGSHYFGGGDSGDGYSSYHHYYIRLSDGKLFLSKKVKDSGDIDSSLADLKRQTGKSLNPRTDLKEDVGSNTNSDDIGTSKVLRLDRGDLMIQGFENLLDEGFRISYVEKSKVRWKRTI